MKTTRRQFLSRASLGSSAAIFAPFFQSVAAHAAGDSAALPKRFVFVVKASGIDPENFTPGGAAYAEVDRLVSTKWDAANLPDTLAPLADFKSRLSVINGLSGTNFKGNHTSGYGTLSCHNSELAPIAPTVDALLGLKHSTGPYPMFGMATNGTLRGQASVPNDSYVYPNLSALKAGQGVAFQASPTKAFNELFGAAVMSQAQLNKDLSLNRNLMDFLKDDAKRVRVRLGTDDRERFDGYIDTFDSLRRRDERKTALADKIKANAPAYVEDKYTSMQHMDRMESQFELGTAAIVAGLTNVITLRPDTLGALYGDLGFGSLGLHAIGHGATLVDGTTSAQMRKKVDSYHMGLLAKMATRFESIPEGDGNMLDNTLIIYLSCAGGSHHGGNSDWPFVLLGGTGGSLKSGNYIQYPRYKQDGHKTIANLYQSIMSAGDLEIGETFGQLDPVLRDLDLAGPLDELLA
ncbi:MAG: hypothetical protein ACI8XO_004684 [Verrucomicrobiales bacterium]|jgi:hypothetical protein